VFIGVFVKTKICTKCKKEQDVFCFGKSVCSRDGLQCCCKVCNKRYRKNNSKKIAKQKKQYYKDNIDPLTRQRKQYRKDNALQIAKQRKQYQKNNASKISEQKKQYNKQRNKGSVLFETYSRKLEVFEFVRPCPKSLELLEVKCAYCGKWMLPTTLQVNNRFQVFNGVRPGEHRFYCSENCKQSCPIYHKKLWPRGFKKATSREVVPLLRQLVLERDGYICQKCGATTETAQLHVHHEKSYTLNKIMANDPDNCWTLCKKCHLWVHSREGCRYSDLKC
jgi:5-methylcytosine-specific restriction endonuclease McrA